MKKALALLLALIMLIGLVACGNSSGDEPVSSAENTTVPTNSGSEEPVDESPVPDSSEPDPQSSAAAEPKQPTVSPTASERWDSSSPLMELPTNPDDPNYFVDAFLAELYNYKVIRNIPTAYESEGWETYWAKGNLLANLTVESVNESTFTVVQAAIAAREAMVQVKPVEDCIWYIWGDEVASNDGSELVFTESSWDNADFVPYLVPYLLEDQSTVKGNLIVIAGGGYTKRNNPLEGYNIAEAFNQLGYNCYVLQRRVAPYAPEDAWMDLQRSVRYLRYYAEDLGLGGMDCIMAAGFSGGGGTVSGAIANLYGDILPTIYDSNYVPDAVDAMNADLDVAYIMYGPMYDLTEASGSFDGWDTENPNLPAVFIGAGYDDATVMPELNITLANYLMDKTTVELHLFAYSLHGFGLGREGTTAPYWVPMADVFAMRIVEENAK